MAEYVYHYRGSNGKPLHFCPACGHDLTTAGSIDLQLSAGGTHVWTVTSRLTKGGRLEDRDGQVVKGNHSGTYCGSCIELLVDLDGVLEIVTETR